MQAPSVSWGSDLCLSSSRWLATRSRDPAASGPEREVSFVGRAASPDQSSPGVIRAAHYRDAYPRVAGGASATDRPLRLRVRRMVTGHVCLAQPPPAPATPSCRHGLDQRRAAGVRDGGSPRRVLRCSAGQAPVRWGARRVVGGRRRRGGRQERAAVTGRRRAAAPLVRARSSQHSEDLSGALPQTPALPPRGRGTNVGCGFVVVSGRGARVGSLAVRSPEAYQEPAGAANAKRTRHDVSLGGPRGTLARRSCPTDEGPPPAQARNLSEADSGRRMANPEGAQDASSSATSGTSR